MVSGGAVEASVAVVLQRRTKERANKLREDRVLAALEGTEEG
jgi:hypothetical protein